MRRFAAWVAFPVFYIFCSSVQAATITSLSEDFDELTPGLAVTSVGAFSAISRSNVDIVGGSLFGSLCVAPESGNCVDLGGSGGDPYGVLQTNNEFAPGTYDLSFDLIGSQRGYDTSTTVTFGNYSQTFNLSSSDVTDGIVVDQLVTLTSAAPLTFEDNFVEGTSGNIGSLLDNVVVNPATAATPEPSALISSALALLVIGLMAHRRVRVVRSLRP